MLFGLTRISTERISVGGLFKTMNRFNSCVVFLLFCLLSNLAIAQGNPPPPPGGPGPDQNDEDFAALGEAIAPAENPVTEEKRVLGKILFWDEQLSSDNTVACGTCHQPAAGGSDFRLGLHPGFDEIFGTDDDVVGSPGIRALDAEGKPIVHAQFGLEAQVTGRASPSFFTSMFADSNFWDGRATDEFVDPLDENSVIISEGGSLESQAVGPILSTVEMAREGRDWEDVVSKLEQVQPLALASNIPADLEDALAGDQRYGDLFQAAFGDDEITPARIGMAIATYERTLVPNETPWDLYVEGDDTAMTTGQIRGWESYIDTPCANCHEPPLFSDDEFRNIGLRPSTEDLGQFDVSGLNNDRGDFKTPSLRNVGLRKMLMHVGWVTDVEDALDFYNAGVNDTGHVQFLDDQDGIPGHPLDINELNIFADDSPARTDLIDFLENGLTDPRVANETFPFDRPTLASEIAEDTVQSVAGLSSDNNDAAASFTISVLDADGVASGNYSTTDALSIAGRIEVDPADTGNEARLYAVIVYNGSMYAMNESAVFVPWDGNESNLPSLGSRVLESVEIVPIIDGLVVDVAGDFLVYLAYEREGGALVYNGEPASFSISM